MCLAERARRNISLSRWVRRGCAILAAFVVLGILCFLFQEDISIWRTRDVRNAGANLRDHLRIAFDAPAWGDSVYVTWYADRNVYWIVVVVPPSWGETELTRLVLAVQQVWNESGGKNPKVQLEFVVRLHEGLRRVTQPMKTGTLVVRVIGAAAYEGTTEIDGRQGSGRNIQQNAQGAGNRGTNSDPRPTNAIR
jgi:hypothetical protein